MFEKGTRFQPKVTHTLIFLIPMVVIIKQRIHPNTYYVECSCCDKGFYLTDEQLTHQWEIPLDDKV